MIRRAGMSGMRMAVIAPATAILLVAAQGDLYAQTGTQDDDISAAIGFLGTIVVILAICVLPSVVAFVRSHPNRWAILLVNVFLGGTGSVGSAR